MRRSVQRWRWIARVGGSGNRRRPRGIVDRWSERSLLFLATEWEVRAVRAGAKPVTNDRRVNAAIDRECGRFIAQKEAK